MSRPGSVEAAVSTSIHMTHLHSTVMRHTRQDPDDSRCRGRDWRCDCKVSDRFGQWQDRLFVKHSVEFRGSVADAVKIFLEHGLTQQQSQIMIGGSLTTRAAHWLLFEDSRHEKNVSTEQDQACSHPWIPRTKSHSWWTCSAGSTPSQGQGSP